MDAGRLRNALDFLYMSGLFEPQVPVLVDGKPVEQVTIEYGTIGNKRVAIAINIETVK
jgi:hypothetical protein